MIPGMAKKTQRTPWRQRRDRLFEIIFKKRALRFFNKLDKFDQERIGRKIEKLKVNPELGKPMIGKLAGLWSLRIGKYRALYQIKRGQLLILILDLGHRKNVYG